MKSGNDVKQSHDEDALAKRCVLFEADIKDVTADMLSLKATVMAVVRARIAANKPKKQRRRDPIIPIPSARFCFLFYFCLSSFVRFGRNRCLSPHLSWFTKL